MRIFGNACRGHNLKGTGGQVRHQGQATTFVLVLDPINLM